MQPDGFPMRQDDHLGFGNERPNRLGWRFNPRSLNGKTYQLSATYEPDGTLHARIFKGTPLLGKTEVLKRVDVRDLVVRCGTIDIEHCSTVDVKAIAAGVHLNDSGTLDFAYGPIYTPTTAPN